MKVLFLDADGVINKKDNFNPAIKNNLYPIDAYCAFLVGRIQLQTGCEVVLSSSWRHHPESVENVSKRVIRVSDVTPDLYDDLNEGKLIIRGDEIQVWLDEHPEVDKYAILDDDIDFYAHQAPNLFKTTFEEGLTDEIAQKVIEHLNG